MGEALWSRARLTLERSRDELASFAAFLRRDRLAALSDERALTRQDELADETRRLGWCLGVLAAAHGLDLLLARREAEGLRWMVATLAEARGLRLEPGAEALPELELEPPLAWRVPLLAAWCANAVGRGSEGALRWTASVDASGGGIVFGDTSARSACARPGAGKDSRHAEDSRGSLELERIGDGLELRWFT